jgi:hypothetical protein
MVRIETHIKKGLKKVGDKQYNIIDSDENGTKYDYSFRSMVDIEDVQFEIKGSDKKGKEIIFDSILEDFAFSLSLKMGITEGEYIDKLNIKKRIKSYFKNADTKGTI